MRERRENGEREKSLSHKATAMLQIEVPQFLMQQLGHVNILSKRVKRVKRDRE